MIQESDQAVQQQQNIRELIEATCKEITNLDVREEELVEDKVTKLFLAVKEYKKKITTVDFKYEMHISDLQMKLHPTMPQEVREHRETDLKTTMANISTVVEDSGKNLDECLQIWTSLQEYSNLEKLQEYIQQK